MVLLCTLEHQEVGVLYDAYVLILLMFRPDALWVLSPEIVVRVSNPTPQEKQKNYGTICGMYVNILM